jgi:hypothetical protein
LDQAEEPPVIVVHGLAHAVAALEVAEAAGRPVVLISAPDAGIYGGPGWFREMVAAAREQVPAAQSTILLDCGDDAGAAQGAIRAGVDGVVFTGRADVAQRLADIAGERGVRFIAERPTAALDLGTVFFASPDELRRRCADILASARAFC